MKEFIKNFKDYLNQPATDPQIQADNSGITILPKLETPKEQDSIINLNLKIDPSKESEITKQ